jgi:biopolymer transport protein ExbD
VIPAMEGSLDLEVPALAHPDEEEPPGPPPIELAVTRSGALLLDLRAVREGDLEATLRALHAQRPSSRLVLKGDREVGYARIRALYAMAARVGFTGVSLRVAHREEDRRGGGE